MTILTRTAIATLAFTFMVASSVNAAERFWFDNIGVEMGVTAVLQQTSGNEYGDSVDQADFAYSADLAFIGRIGPGQTLSIVFEAGYGEAAADNFDMRATPDYDAANSENGLDVAQAYYEGEFMDGKLIFMFGRMDAHSLTDGNEYAGDETSQFLNGLFVRSIGVIFAEHSNYYVPTFAFIIQPIDLFSLTYTYSQDTGEDFFNEGHQWFEAGLHPSFGSVSANLRVGYAMHDLPHSEIATSDETTNSGMINVSADITIGDNIGLFARYALQDSEIAENEVESAVSGGLSIGGGIWGRDDDGFGVAYGTITLNENLYSDTEGETVIEFYYRMQVNDHLAITVDFQMFSNLEREENREVNVFGLRSQSDF